MIHERRLLCGDSYLNVASTTGPDRRLILLHGLSRRWQDYLPYIPTLAARYSIDALDHRGHGRSDRSSAPYDLGLHVRGAADYVRSHADHPVSIFGHSLGALVALGVAATCPDLVEAIILEDPPSAEYLARLEFTPYHATFEAMRRLSGSVLPLSEIACLLGDTELPGPDGSAFHLRDIRDPASLRFTAASLALIDPEVFTPPLLGRWLQGVPPIDAQLASVRCPVLLLAGNESLGGMFPAEDARRWARTLPDACLVQFPQIGHQIHHTDPASVFRHTFHFLESLHSPNSY